MPVEETVKLKIKCDNPDCPGNTLNPEAREGWIFVSGEVYGNPTGSCVVCSPGCLSGWAAAYPQDRALFAPPTPDIPEGAETPYTEEPAA